MAFKMKGFSGFGIDSPVKFCGPHSDFAKGALSFYDKVKKKVKTTKTKIKKKRKINKELRKRKRNIRKHGNPYGTVNWSARTLKSSDMRTYSIFEGND